MKMHSTNGFIIRSFRNIRFAFSLLFLSSCASMGPKTIPLDGFSYNQTISTQESEQLLYNIVKLRYAETPIFVNVSSIINQYSRDARAGVESENVFGGASVTPDISGGWSDKPTITYTPMSGKAFTETMLNPVPPSIIFYFIQSGWSASRLLNLTTTHINGIRNSVNTANRQLPADKEFKTVLQLLEIMQEKSIISLDVGAEEESKNINVFFPQEIADDTVRFTVDKFKNILNLSSDINRFPIRYGSFQKDRKEIYLQTHSLLEILMALSHNVDVPAEHISEGKTYESGNAETNIKLKIHSSEDKPANGFVLVKNRGYWFYIDDSDWESKATFGIVQVLLNLSKNFDPSRSPLISIGN